ncbi:YchJ family metal-binding protein [Streptomyces sp. C10-9-1]|uniref:YchJ family protein n=1 Tax=Streptomyces sp. C10-9-1 TaxID=1859285 RepID=UPI0021114B8F|nr:YchJ family metal-binding protein [Streptomyces sp. C10-9-1]MCQ6551631.1 YchJ family metal-binding protein [Streptomyces sp. C10-9-1]
MPRHTKRRERTAPALPDAGSPCPCGLPAAYGECCGRLHSGEEAAPTAERLMRSRYSAFVVRDTAYLLRTWHSSTRPPHLELDEGMRWSGLEVTGATDGSAFHSRGTVTFRARYRHHGKRGELHERSEFAREGGAWVYVDGSFLD